MEINSTAKTPIIIYEYKNKEFYGNELLMFKTKLPSGRILCRILGTLNDRILSHNDVKEWGKITKKGGINALHRRIKY